MKFDFSDISFAGIASSVGSDAERTEPAQNIDTIKFLDTFLNSPPKTSIERDSINEFYSDLAKGVLRYAPTGEKSDNRLERTLAINKNTADHHGRT